jgi:hypothetical protein
MFIMEADKAGALRLCKNLKPLDDRGPAGAHAGEIIWPTLTLKLL